MSDKGVYIVGNRLLPSCCSIAGHSKGEKQAIPGYFQTSIDEKIADNKAVQYPWSQSIVRHPGSTPMGSPLILKEVL